MKKETDNRKPQLTAAVLPPFRSLYNQLVLDHVSQRDKWPVMCASLLAFASLEEDERKALISQVLAMNNADLATEKIKELTGYLLEKPSAIATQPTAVEAVKPTTDAARARADLPQRGGKAPKHKVRA